MSGLEQPVHIYRTPLTTRTVLVNGVTFVSCDSNNVLRRHVTDSSNSTQHPSWWATKSGESGLALGSHSTVLIRHNENYCMFTAICDLCSRGSMPVRSVQCPPGINYFHPASPVLSRNFNFSPRPLHPPSDKNAALISLSGAVFSQDAGKEVVGMQS